MPYCRNCGAKLEDNARFCRVCGTPVVPESAQQTKLKTSVYRQQPAPKTGVPFWAIMLIIAAALVLVAVVIVFLPIEQVDFDQSNQVTAANLDTFELNLEAEIANVNLFLRDLPGNQTAVLNVSATGWRGIFGSNTPVALHFDEDRSDGALIWTAKVFRSGNWPIYNRLDINCNVYVDPEADLEISVVTETGSVAFNGNSESNFQNLKLQATTGSITASLNENVIISGAFQLETTTGRVQLNWNNAGASGTIPIGVKTTTGSIELNVTQTRQLTGNVTLDAEATTGGLTMTLDLQNDVGARIAASTVMGGINVEQQGFSGNSVPLQSDNYPSRNNFGITLRTTLGGVDIDASYDLAGIRS